MASPLLTNLLHTPEAVGNQNLIDFTVVVPAFRGAATIADCVRSLRQAMEGKRGEIIVVESSGDNTGEILRRHFPEVKLIQSSQRLSVGEARNHGASQARGAILFFVDQDCVVPPDWIERLAGHLRDSRVGAAGGSIGIRNPFNLSGCGVYFLEFLTHFPKDHPPQRNTNFLLGCNGAYRAEIFAQVAFPAQTLAEDVLFTHNIRCQGFDVIYDPGVTVHHWNREGWGEFLRYNRKMGVAAAGYHRILQKPLIKPFLRFPLLIFVAPLVILPKIFFNLMGSPPGYLLRYALSLPICLVGNLVWATAFRQAVLVQHRASRGAIDPDVSTLDGEIR